MQHILSENTLTVIMSNGMPRSLHRGVCGEEAWTRALRAVHDDDFDTIENILDKPRGINRYFEEHGIRVEGGVLYYHDRELDSYAATKAIQFVEQGLPATALINFLVRVERNPSYRAVQDLYRFLEHNGMPLTPEGCFMAYKKVRRAQKIEMSGEPLVDLRSGERAMQFVDIYSGQICNDPGEKVTMARNQVDENPNRTCSYGLHVCSYDYLPGFGRENGDTVVMVSVDPADVVAIPKDYDNAKMRVCAYEVIREIPEWRGHTWDSAVVEEHSENDGDSAEMTQDDIDSMIAEMDDEAKTRLGRYVRDLAEQKHVPTPISSEMRIRFLLEHGHTASQVYNLVFLDA